ncbi:Motility protein B [Thalassocella blandensis]|nr:Motility protein B [Thalassocella blandensis]
MIRRANIDKRWETKINHERWLVSYSDFITLLFAFFVVMYSVSQVSESKYRELTQTLQSTFSTRTTSSQQVSELEQVDSLQSIQQRILPLIEEEFSALHEQGEISVRGNHDWLEIELDSSTLFSSASAELTPPARKIIAAIADKIALNSNRVIVSGHTDNLPISNDAFANNWALSSARAVAVVNALAYGGVNPERLSAVGYGEFKPIADNETEAGREKNRRVVISVSSTAEESPEMQVQLSKREGFGQQGVDTQQGQNNQSENLPGSQSATSQATETNAPSLPRQESAVNPVRLQDGSLLFSSDPDLPRVNPVVSPSISPAPR